MFSSLQSNRPQLPKPSPLAPMNQQPVRRISYVAQPEPRSQIEAMPPFQVPLAIQRPTQTALNSSTRHPVFFTPRLKKAPNGVGAGNEGWGSPVAMGYVYNDGVVRESGSRL